MSSTFTELFHLLGKHDAIVGTLRLANNGYTFARNMTLDEIAVADAAVVAGLVRKCTHVSLHPKDNLTRYYVIDK